MGHADCRRRVYFTSDWHVGHANVLTFDQRPFRDLNHMHESLVDHYNAVVGVSDLCYFLGDMGWGKDGALRDVMESLNGTKVLIAGNHDRGGNAMHRLGFGVVLQIAAIQIYGKVVTMTHCPLRGVWREDCSQMSGSVPGDNWHKEWKHGPKFSIDDFGQYHLHGHTHKCPKERTLDRQFDVGVRANFYRPVPFGAIESWIVKREESLASAAGKTA